MHPAPASLARTSYSGTIYIAAKAKSCGMWVAELRIPHPQVRCLRDAETRVAESGEIALLGFHTHLLFDNILHL